MASAPESHRCRACVGEAVTIRRHSSPAGGASSSSSSSRRSNRRLRVPFCWWASTASGRRHSRGQRWIGWTTEPTVFETTAAQINAGAIFIGELEGRVKTLIDSLAGQDVVWVLPGLQETLFAGQHSRSPQGLLDALLPHVESGAITLVSEVTPTAAELLLAERPRVASAFEIVRVRPLDEADTIAVVRHALEEGALGVETDDATLAESFELAQQFLPGIAPPGNVLRLLQSTAAEAAEQGAESFAGSDVLATLAAARVSRLPSSIPMRRSRSRRYARSSSSVCSSSRRRSTRSSSGSR